MGPHRDSARQLRLSLQRDAIQQESVCSGLFISCVRSRYVYCKRCNWLCSRSVYGKTRLRAGVHILGGPTLQVLKDMVEGGLDIVLVDQLRGFYVSAIVCC